MIPDALYATELRSHDEDDDEEEEDYENSNESSFVEPECMPEV